MGGYDNGSFWLGPQDHLHECESHASQHQQYSDQYSHTADWLQGLMDRLEVCAEPSPDKHAIQTKLDRLQVSDDHISKGLFLKDIQ